MSRNITKRKNTKIGNIGNEIDRFKNLSIEDLLILRSIYKRRLKQVSEEIKRIQRSTDIPRRAIDMVKKIRHCDDVWRRDIINISEKFTEESHWSSSHGRFSNDTLSACIVNTILDYYNIECNPHELLELYDIDGTQFNILLFKVKEWAKENYWRT